MLHRPHALIGCLLVWLTTAGCAPLNHGGKSPLAAAQTASDSIGVEVLFVRVPRGDEQALRSIWKELDETKLPVGLRRKWDANGLRAGIVGEHPPAALERLLNQSDAPLPTDAEVTVNEFQKEPPVRRREMWLRPGRPARIAVVGEQSQLPEITLLARGEDGLASGQSFRKVKGLIQVQALPQADGRVRLELLPQIEHGEPRQRYVPSDSLPGEAMVRFEFGQDRTSFAELQLNATLSPGQMVVLGSREDCPGTLGDHFFTAASGEQAVQRLVMVRLAQTGGSELFEEPAGLESPSQSPVDKTAQRNASGEAGEENR